jgi:hypothetical protein
LSLSGALDVGLHAVGALEDTITGAHVHLAGGLRKYKLYFSKSSFHQ